MAGPCGHIPGPGRPRCGYGGTTDPVSSTCAWTQAVFRSFWWRGRRGRGRRAMTTTAPPSPACSCRRGGSPSIWAPKPARSLAVPTPPTSTRWPCWTAGSWSADRGASSRWPTLAPGRPATSIGRGSPPHQAQAHQAQPRACASGSRGTTAGTGAVASGAAAVGYRTLETSAGCWSRSSGAAAGGASGSPVAASEAEAAASPSTCAPGASAAGRSASAIASAER